MTHYNYLIIGGDMTADAAVYGIRDVDAKGSVGLIGEEPHPYGRKFGKGNPWKAFSARPKR
jgi:hypothetical protein